MFSFGKKKSPKKKLEKDIDDRSKLSATELQVYIRNADTILFENKASSISTVNELGSLDILPRHTNFITLITERIVVHISDTEQKEFPLNNGVMRVFNNQIDVFLGINDISIEVK